MVMPLLVFVVAAAAMMMMSDCTWWMDTVCYRASEWPRRKTRRVRLWTTTTNALLSQLSLSMIAPPPPHGGRSHTGNNLTAMRRAGLRGSSLYLDCKRKDESGGGGAKWSGEAARALAHTISSLSSSLTTRARSSATKSTVSNYRIRQVDIYL